MSRFLLLAIVTFCFAISANEPLGRYDTIVKRLREAQAKYPEFSQIFSIGQNDEGLDVLALRVSLTPGVVDSKKIGQIVVSTHHGNEDGAPLFTMRFIEELLPRYRSPELWQGKLADMEWTIIPVLNISGYDLGERHEHDVDPNRDYPSACGSEPSGKLKSVRLMMDLFKTRSFAASVTVHGYDGSLSYPYGMVADSYKTHDDEAYHALFGKAASHNRYKFGNGAELLYPANGCYEDYIYWKYGSWSMLLELLDGSSEDIELTVPAIARFFDEVNSSPSVKNQFLGNCLKSWGPDLRIE